MTAPTIDPAIEAQLIEQCQAIWDATEEAERAERRERKQEMWVRVWNGAWDLKHVVTDYISADANPVDNDTGTHELVLPWDDPVVQWAYNEQQRLDDGDFQNIHASFDYCGARISGRLDDLTIHTDENGITTGTLTFLDDYENLKWYTVWSNPFLPAIFQFPRVFILPGPARWVLLLTLHLQLFREHNPLITLPDDPMNFGSYAGGLDQSTWDVVVEPLTLQQDLAAGSVWAIATSRFKNYHDMASPIVEDAEYSFKLRRWFEGDPPPWPGANLKHGALVVGLEDHSGVFAGTAHGGSMWDGLVRTIGDFTEDFLETSYTALTDEDIPSAYYTVGNRLQDKRWPFVVYTSDMPGVMGMTHIYKPAKGIQILCGGHSMPGVNELISAGIQALGDIIGNLLQIGSIGGSTDTVLKPFYEDTVLAWMAVKLFARAQKQGPSRYFEYFQAGGDKAYTISSMMVLRTAAWATRTRRINLFDIADGGPYLVGDNGHGHFYLGHRVGCSIKGDPRHRVHMDRVRSLRLSATRDQAPKWSIIIGDQKDAADPATRAWERIENILGAIHDLGVF